MAATISTEMSMGTPYDNKTCKYAIRFSGVTHNGVNVHGDIRINHLDEYDLALFASKTGRQYPDTAHKDLRNEAISIACDKFGFVRYIVMGKGERLKLNKENMAIRDRDISSVLERLGLDIRKSQDAVYVSDFMRCRWKIGISTDELEKIARGYCHKQVVAVTLPTMTVTGDDTGAAHSGVAPMDEKVAAITTLFHGIVNRKSGNPFIVYKHEIKQAAIACGWNENMESNHIDYLDELRNSLGLFAE